MRLNEGVTLHGTKCSLVPYTKDLVETYHEWFVNDPELLETTCSELLTLEEEFANQESWRSDESKLTFLIRDTTIPDHPLCGDINCFLSPYYAEDWAMEEVESAANPVSHGVVGELNLMVAEKHSRRKGIAEEAMRLFTEYMLIELKDLKILVAKIQISNAPSIALFEKLGFTEWKRIECFNEVHFVKSATMRPAGIVRRPQEGTCAEVLSGYSSKDEQPHRSRRGRSAVPDMIHGRPSQTSETVGKTFASGRIEGVNAIMRDRAEAVYRSISVEPLGHGRVRGYSLPPSDFRYGRSSDVKDGSIGSVINPPEQAESEAVRCMYRKTHRNYLPGERVDREYAWPDQVDSAFVFGTIRNKVAGDIELALKWARPTDDTQTVIKRLQDFRDATSDVLGHPRNSLQGGPPVEPGFRFGIRYDGGGLTAGDCINGNFGDVSELLPDARVGKSIPRIKA